MQDQTWSDYFKHLTERHNNALAVVTNNVARYLCELAKRRTGAAVSLFDEIDEAKFRRSVKLIFTTVCQAEAADLRTEHVKENPDSSTKKYTAIHVLSNSTTSQADSPEFDLPGEKVKAFYDNIFANKTTALTPEALLRNVMSVPLRRLLDQTSSFTNCLSAELEDSALTRSTFTRPEKLHLTGAYERCGLA